MTMKKVSVTLDEKLIAQAKRRAKPGTLSSFLNEALRLHLQRDRIAEYLDAWEREHGPIPQKDLDEADRAWDEHERKLKDLRG
jgi:Arc/MetJ-type ribon-helix-helix transcriptional regulator